MHAEPTTGLRKLPAAAKLSELPADQLKAAADRLECEVDFWIEQVRQLERELKEVA